jgi:hypothetical protein
MLATTEQLAAICTELGELSSGWTDPLCLDFLLSVAHAHGVLPDVGTLQILDVEHDTFLVSVEVSPGIYLHAEPTHWGDVRPPIGTVVVEAVRHVLGRLEEIAAVVREVFLRTVGAIVATAVFPAHPG